MFSLLTPIERKAPMKTYKCSRCYPKNAKVITVPTYHYIQAPSQEVAFSVMQARFPHDFRFDVVECVEAVQPTPPSLSSPAL